MYSFLHLKQQKLFATNAEQGELLVALRKVKKEQSKHGTGEWKMNIIRSCTLMIFAMGVAIIAKYMGFEPWVEANAWIGIPMAVFGGVGVFFLFGKER